VVKMRIAKIIMGEEIKHAKEQSLMWETRHSASSAPSVSSETFTPGPEQSFQTFFSSFANCDIADLHRIFTSAASNSITVILLYYYIYKCYTSDIVIKTINFLP
jgi:hypothetical protein